MCNANRLPTDYGAVAGCGTSYESLPIGGFLHASDLRSSSAFADDRAALPRVSVVVLAYNEEVNLPACLASLHGLVCEVVVVDSGSTDRTREMATHWCAVPTLGVVSRLAPW